MRGDWSGESVLIESLDQLEAFAQNNPRLKGLINRLKHGIKPDDKVLALASILRTLQRKRIPYTEHFVRHCLLYLFEEGRGVEKR